MRSLRGQALLLILVGLLSGAGLVTLRASGGVPPLPAPSPAAAGTPTTATTPAPTATEPAPTATEPAPAAQPAPPTAPPPAAVAAPQPPELAVRVDALLADAALSGLGVGLSVRDESGAEVLTRAGTQALLPASTTKLVTAAAALGRLGPGYRYTTQVLAASGPDADGTLAGDVVLVGSGDPALATPTFREQVSPERPATSLAALADQLVAAGVRRISGGVLADPTVFADQPVADGWRDRYFEELDATLVSGLTVDGGRKLFVSNGRLQASASPDPASEAAAALLTLLRQRGVQVDGGVATLGAPTVVGLVLASVQSPPLDELLRWTVQRSDNHMADAIFRTIGVAAGDPTWAGAEAAVRAVMAPLGLDWAGVRLADGSGLSREDRLPASFLSGLDAVIARAEVGQLWASWQAVAGESGTLRNRLRGTLAEQRLRGKTGSLRDVRALTGSVDGPEGRRYHFALLVNAVPRASRDAVRSLQDELVLALAEDLHGCVRLPAPTPAAPEAPPYALSCAAA